MRWIVWGSATSSVLISFSLIPIYKDFLTRESGTSETEGFVSYGSLSLLVYTSLSTADTLEERVAIFLL